MHMKINKSPIGFFDSGLGGLSVWLEVNKLLPTEQTIYLADSANAPYGVKSPEKIIEFSIKNSELLIEKGCKMIVVACNTATTHAIKELRKRFQVPFVGIEPAIKPAALLSKSGKVGVLATAGTLVSDLFLETSAKYASEVITMTQEGTGLVELIENGHLFSSETKLLLENYISPMIEAGIDYLVLGCTHYPFLRPILEQILPSNVTILDSGEAIARRVDHLLDKLHLKNKLGRGPKEIRLGDNVFYTNRSEILMQDVLNDMNILAKAEFKFF